MTLFSIWFVQLSYIHSQKWFLLTLAIVTVKLGKTWKLEIFQECLLCYDQSQQRSGHVSKPQNHKLINVLACSSVFSHLIGFFFCATITFQKYFWFSQFSWFDCKWSPLLSSRDQFFVPPNKCFNCLHLF